MEHDNKTINEWEEATPKEEEPLTKGQKAKRLVLEIVLSVLTILAICFLPALHLYISNMEEMELNELMGSVYLFAAIGLGIFAILRVIIRKRPYFAGCVAAVVTFLMVNFSLLTTLFKTLIPNNYIAAIILSMVAAVLLVVGSIFLFLRLCKKESNGRSIMIVLCIVFIGLLLFNVVTCAVKMNGTTDEEDAELPQIEGLSDDEEENPEISVPETEEATAEPSPDVTVPPETIAPETQQPDTVELTEAPVETPTPEPTATPVAKTKTPNIYLLVFDEYGAMGAMEKYYSYDAEPFRNFLRTAHVNWSEHSYSMTKETKVSMTDLNMMDYVAYRKRGNLSTLKSYRKNSTIKKVFSKKLGYQLYQYSTHYTWFISASNLRDSKTMAKFQKTTADGVETDQILRQQSIFGSFDDLIGALTPQDKIKGNSESLQKYGFYSADEIRESQAFKSHEYKNAANTVLNALEFWEDERNFQSTEKRMIVSYIKSPHVPFMFDEYGQIRSYGTRMYWKDPKYYYGQYLFITKHMEVILKTIISSDPESIIIIMSDHGVRAHDQGFIKITEKDNCWSFLALYYQGDEVDIEGMSPINVLRMIATNLGVKMDPVKDYVTVDSKDDLSDVNYKRK